MPTPLPLQYASSPPPITTRTILLRWEKLRLLYNLILFLIVATIITLSAPTLWLTFQFWAQAILAAIFANLLYCIGPWLDLWLKETRFWRPWITPILFTLGLAFSLLVTLLASLATAFAATLKVP